MHKTLYIVHHCQAQGQEPDASLTPEGEQQAQRLAGVLAGYDIDRIVSSPFVRAVQSITPLAERLHLPVETDARLTERILCSGSIPHWLEQLKASFEDMDLCLEGGESSRTAMDRGVAAIEDILQHPAHTTVIVSHGNLMTLLLRHFDKTVGFDVWKQLTNPDVYQIDIHDDTATMKRLWS